MKKLTAILMIICMLLTSVPFGVFAENVTEENTTQATTQETSEENPSNPTETPVDPPQNPDQPQVPEVTECTHENLTPKEKVEATCTTDGNIACYDCDDCDKYLIDGENGAKIVVEKIVIPAINHKNKKYNEKVDATCTNKGAIEYWACSDCGKNFSDEACTQEVTEIEIAVKEHTPAEAVFENEVKASCSAGGSYDEVVYCSECNAELSRDNKTTSATGHSDYEIISSTATCTEKGTMTIKCNSCDAEITFEAPAKGHNLTTTVTDATCKEEGSVTTECASCDFKETKVIAAKNHVWDNGKIDSEATCANPGVKIFTCACGETKKEEIPAKGHDYSAVITKAASCTEEGIRTYTCACGDKKTEAIPMVQHNWDGGTRTVNPTCTEVGVMEFKCTNCEEKSYKIISALEHKIESHEKKDPTCTESGHNAYNTCKNEGCSYSTKVELPALGHSWSNWEEHKATNTEPGYIARACSVCEETETVTLSAGGHEWDEGTVTLAATCTTPGTVTYKCIAKDHPDCSFTHTATIPAKGHNEKLVYTAADCEKAGSVKMVCETCKESVGDETVIPAIGHILKSYEEKNATCTEDGWKAYVTCEREGCDYTTYEKIPATGHKNKDVTTKATLSKNGKIENKCIVCGDVSKSTTIYYPKTITLSATSYTYDGKVKAPTVTVKDSNGKALKKDTDFTVKYASGRKNPGKYTVTVTFKGNYSGTKKLSFTILPQTVTGYKATQTTSTITLSWNKVTGATGYAVYKYNTKTGKLDLFKKTTATSLKISSLSIGTEYKYAIRAYTVSGSDTVYGAYTNTFTTATKPAKVTNLKVTKQTANSITVSWSKVAGAEGYRVYSYNASTKKYTSLGYVKNGVTSFTVKNIKLNTTNRIAVRAYINTTLNPVAVWGDYSAVLTYKITPTLKVISTEKGKATLSWSTISGVAGYEIYYSTKKDSGYKLLYTAKNNASGIKLSLTSGATYYFRVQAYTGSGSSKVCSGYQTIAIKVK